MSWNESNVKQNIWKFRSACWLQSVDLSRGIFVVFLLTQGLSNTQVGLLQSILFWTILVTEIPSGLLADYSRRKISMILSFGCGILTFGLFPLATNFWHFAAVFVLWGLSFAFASGASSALLYDGLKSAGEKWLNTHLKENARIRSVSTFIVALSIALSGYVYKINPNYIFYISAACLVLGLFLTSLIDESPRPKATGAQTASLWASLKGFSLEREGKNLLVLMGGLAFLEACHTPLFVMSQSLLQSRGLDASYLTVIMALSFGMSALAMNYASKLKIKNLKKVTYLTLMAVGIGCGAIYLAESTMTIAGLLILLNAIPSMLFVHTDHYFQENSPSEIRASFGSIRSFVSSTAIAINFIAMGWLADSHGAKSPILVLPLLLVAGALVIKFHRWKAVSHVSY